MELIKNFLDQLRHKNLERFQMYAGRDPIRKTLREFAKIEANEEQVAQFKAYAQMCTANNSSY